MYLVGGGAQRLKTSIPVPVYVGRPAAAAAAVALEPRPNLLRLRVLLR